MNKMNKQEIEMIELIRGSRDPGKALEIAVSIIIGYLQQPESSQIQPRGSAQGPS